MQHIIEGYDFAHIHKGDTSGEEEIEERDKKRKEERRGGDV